MYIFSKGSTCDWSQDSVIGIATHYGLYGPEIEPQWGQDFLFPGVKQPGHGVDHPPLSSPEVKKRVELYLVFPPCAFMACSGGELYLLLFLALAYLTLIFIYCRYKSSHMQVLLHLSNIFLYTFFLFLFFFSPPTPH
jgi:hypothetical protein